jgi:hypothetical protein
MSKRILILLVPIVFVLGLIVGYLGYYFYELPNSKLLAEQRRDYLDKAIDYETKAAKLVTDSDNLWVIAVQRVNIELTNSAPEMTKQWLDLASEYRQQALKYRELAAK